MATIATPHASCSLAGLYNPIAFGVVENNSIPLKICWPLPYKGRDVNGPTAELLLEDLVAGG